MTETIQLGYWKINGRAQTSRLLFEYIGAKWENVFYNDFNQWFGNDKKKILDWTFEIFPTSSPHRRRIENLRVLSYRAINCCKIIT